MSSVTWTAVTLSEITPANSSAGSTPRCRHGSGTMTIGFGPGAAAIRAPWDEYQLLGDRLVVPVDQVQAEDDRWDDDQDHPGALGELRGGDDHGDQPGGDRADAVDDVPRCQPGSRRVRQRRTMLDWEQVKEMNTPAA